MFLRLLAALLILALPARANLGDTVEQCVKRYGRPLTYTEANAKIPFGTLVFIAGGYTLLVFLADTREVGARVSKTDKSAFTEAEMNTIMSADITTPWKSVATTQPDTIAWLRGDGATLYYDEKNKMMIFTSPAMAAVLKNPPPAVAASTNAAPAPPVPMNPGATFAPAPPTPFEPITPPSNSPGATAPPAPATAPTATGG